MPFGNEDGTGWIFREEVDCVILIAFEGYRSSGTEEVLGAQS